MDLSVSVLVQLVHRKRQVQHIWELVAPDPSVPARGMKDRWAVRARAPYSRRHQVLAYRQLWRAFVKL